MAKVQIEIEIPDGHEIVDVCNVSKHFGGRPACVVNTMPAKPLLINGVPSDWPEWLTCDYVAADKNGQIFGYNGKPPHPYRGTGKWQAEGEGEFGQIFGTAIVIPGPWEESLRKNSNKKSN